MAEWIIIIMVAVVLLFITKIFKHHFLSRLSRSLFLAIIILLALLSMVSYLTSNDIIQTDNKMILTGASFFENIRTSFEETNLLNETIELIPGNRIPKG